MLEKLGAATKQLRDADGARALLARWRLLLLNSDAAASPILAEPDAERGAGAASDEAHAARTYLTNNADRMRYWTARQLALPVGSSVVEATCKSRKSLLGLRLERPGSRWKTETGEHIVQLRALALSHGWDRALELTLALLRKPVRRAAWAA